MQIVRDLGGYSYGRSDLVRRAMSKKKMDVMLEEKEYFIHGKTDKDGNVEIAGCIRNGIPEPVAEEIFNDMVSFAEYAFNKSHAAAYAVLAYETGYLKCHYPVEFMAALMTSVMGDAGQISKYIRNCAEMGIEVLPPCVNKSKKKFSVDNGKIRFGLLGVKNVGENAIDAMIKAREEKGEPKDIFTFIQQLDISQVNKKALESLIRSGACRCLSENKAALMSVYEGALESAQNSSKKNLAGQMSLFDLSGQMGDEDLGVGTMEGAMPDVADFPEDISLAMEKEMLGVYITGHPLRNYADKIKAISTVTSEELNHKDGEDDDAMGPETSGDDGIKDGMRVIMAGMVASKRTLITKSSKMMAFVALEDLYGVSELVVFPNVYEKCSHYLQGDDVIAVRGTLNFKEGEAPSVLADEILPIDQAMEAFSNGPVAGRSSRQSGGWQKADRRSEARPSEPQKKVQPQGMIKVKMPAGDDMNIELEQIKTTLKRHRGRAQVLIYLPDGKILKTDSNLWAEPSDALCRQLMALVGAENVKVQQ